MSTLQFLVNLGLPSAFVGMVLIAILFKRSHGTISAWAASIAVGLVGLFGLIQLVDVLRGKDVIVQFEPADVQGFTPSGRPVDLKIEARRGSRVLNVRRVEKLSERAYKSRPLSLGEPQGAVYAVEYQDFQLGVLNQQRLRDAGWQPAEECARSAEEIAGTPRFWHTSRVHAGDTYKLGPSQYGAVQISARSFTSDGKALVTLALGGHGLPRPTEVAIANKGLDVQSFAEVPEFYIAVREADFESRNPWAAFSVFARH